MTLFGYLTPNDTRLYLTPFTFMNISFFVIDLHLADLTESPGCTQDILFCFSLFFFGNRTWIKSFVSTQG